MLKKYFHLITIFVVIININFSIQDGEAAKICYECDSKKDDNCLKGLDKIGNCTVTTTECFIRLNDDGSINRGCLAENDKCENPSCSKCTASDKPCNSNNVCKTCDSSKNSICSQTDATDMKLNSICTAADTQCITKVNDKYIERRCATSDDVKSCTDTKTCQLCSGGICNTGIFPTDRLNCYQCSASDTTCPKPTDAQTKPCALYVATDECYTIGTNDTSMTRGCLSDTNAVCKKDNKECKFCSNKNGCNNITYEIEQSLKCIQCNSTTTPNCTTGDLDSSFIKSCDKKIIYSAEENCYTQVKDGVTLRGCLYDRDTNFGNCIAANGCSSCNDKDGCNNLNALIKECIRCRSDENKYCRKDATKINGTTCTNDSGMEIIQCYEGEWNNIVVRGCLVDADIRMQAICLEKDNNQCTYCNGTNCNTIERSNANLNTINLSLLATILFILLINFK